MNKEYKQNKQKDKLKIKIFVVYLKREKVLWLRTSSENELQPHVPQPDEVNHAFPSKAAAQIKFLLC